MIVDATNMIAGRLGAYIAKQLLLGEKIEIVNSEKAVISGNKYDIFETYAHKTERGTHTKGPFAPKQPHLILKRIIRGMLPHSQQKGRNAFRNLICHIGVPKALEGQQAEKLEKFNKSTLRQARTVTLKQVSEYMGIKVQ